jgi:hypothetical protein
VLQFREVKAILEIDDDILEAVQEIALRERKSTGEILSALARKGLASLRSTHTGGVPVLPSRGEIVTLRKVQDLMDSEGV